MGARGQLGVRGPWAYPAKTRRRREMRPWTGAGLVEEPTRGVRTTEPRGLEISLKPLRGTAVSHGGYFLPKYGGEAP